MREPVLFGQLMEISDPSQRACFLREACSGNAALRSRLEHLLAAAGRMGSFLESPVLPHGALTPTLAVQDTTRTKTSFWSPHAPEEQAMLSPDLPDPTRETAIELLKPYLEPSDRTESHGRLAHYEILKLVGQGAFGLVLKGFDTRLERLVAIKVLLPALATTSPPRKRFLREARTAASIRHENVIGIHSVDEQPLPYLVMELVDGIDLQAYLDDSGPFPAQEVAQIGLQVLAGLAAAHQSGIVHRDLKPSNLLLVRGTPLQIKITDFGLARTIDDASQTQTGQIAGTPLYMSPEQAQGRTLTPASDLFSVGSVLYTLITGRPPFRSSTALGVMKRICEDTARPIAEIMPETPPWMIAMINKLHAKNPQERFSTAQEAHTAWADAWARSTLQPTHPLSTPSPSFSFPTVNSDNNRSTASSPSSRSKRFQKSLAVGCIGLLTISVIWFVQNFASFNKPTPIAVAPPIQSVEPPPAKRDAPPSTSPSDPQAPTASPPVLPTSTSTEAEESFRVLLGATRQQLTNWANQQQDRFIIESLNPRHGTNPSKIDAIAIHNPLGSKWELHDVLDDGADFQQNWARFRPAWRMPLLEDNEVRTLFIWVADIPYWRTFVGRRDVMQQYQDRSVEQFFPSSLFCHPNEALWTLTQAPLPGLQIETLVDISAVELPDQMTTYSNRGWRPLRLMQHVGFAEPRFAVVFAENPDQLKWEYAEYTSETLLLKAIEQQRSKPLLPKSISSSVLDSNIKFRVLWSQ